VRHTLIPYQTQGVLLDRGYHVTILSKAWVNDSPNNRLTSQITGALWEYPPAVCGSHTDEISLRRSKDWAMVSYQVGVQTVRSAFFFPGKLEDNLGHMHKMSEIRNAGTYGFSHRASLIQEFEINPETAFVMPTSS
jgi:D-amino-acid oxidase